MRHLNHLLNLVCTCFIILTFSPASAYAEDAQDDTGPLVIDVVGQQTTLTTETPEQVEERLSKVPGGTNFLETADESRLATLTDTFTYLPGIVLQEFSGSLDQPRLNVRGSGIQGNPVNRGVLLRQDYLPVNEADGSFIIGLLEPKDSKYVIAQRGANSRALGVSTLGGDINFVSPTGRDGVFGLRAESGDYGRQGLLGSLGWASDNFDIRGSFSKDDYDGYRHHSALERESIRGNFGLYLGESFESRSYISATDLFFEFPFALSEEAARNNPRSVMGDNDKLGPIIGGVQGDPLTLALGVLSGDTQLPEFSELQNPQPLLMEYLLNVYRRDPHRRVRQKRFANLSTIRTGDIQHSVGFYTQNTDDEFVDPLSQAISDIDTTGLEWKINGDINAIEYSLGVHVQESDFDRVYYVNTQQDGSRGEQYADLDMQASYSVVDLQLEYPITERWSVNGQIQRVRSEREALNQSNGESLVADHQFNLPKIGTVFNFNSHWRVYANVSASKEAPSFWEIASNKADPISPQDNRVQLNELDVQKAKTYEIGGQGRVAFLGMHSWQLSYYRTSLEDELLSTASDSGLIDDTINYVGETRHDGVELGLGGMIPLFRPVKLSYQLAYTYSDFFFEEGEYASNRMAGVPKQALNAQILFKVMGLSFGPSVRHSPDRNPTDHENTVFQDPYTIIGFLADYRSPQGWRLFAKVDNLKDKVYNASYIVRSQGDATLPTFLPGTGRSVDFGFALDF